MPIDSSSQLKETFNRMDIKTMRKDLKRLRETDSLKERQKISNANPIAPAQNNSPLEQLKSETPVIKNTLPAPAPDNRAIKDIGLKTNVKEYATEEEKQQIFLAKSKRSDLEKELNETPEAAAPITLEKDQISQQYDQLQKKLEMMMEREEKETSESQKEILEKKRWQQERELKKKENQIKNLNQTRQQFAKKEIETRANLATIEESLKTVYGDIAKRQPVKKETSGQTPEPAPKPAYQAAPKEKSYVKDASPAVKETLQESTRGEDAQRRKFLEDVEKWANSSDDKNQDNG